MLISVAPNIPHGRDSDGALYICKRIRNDFPNATLIQLCLLTFFCSLIIT